jgi:hypothetical protein
MDSFTNKKTEKKVLVEDISEEFPMTFLMGELSNPKFSIHRDQIAVGLPSQLLSTSSNWLSGVNSLAIQKNCKLQTCLEEERK